MVLGQRCLYIGFVFLWVTACRTSESAVKSAETPVSGETACEIAIVGGGVGGLHTAFRLGPEYGAKVCLFEKEDRLGGRIFDIAKTPGENDGPYIGQGGRRVMDTQDIVFKLAKELDLELEKPEQGADLIFARGKHATNKDEFLPLYTGLAFDRARPDAETQLLEQLMNSPERANVDNYPDFKSYIKKVVGANGYDYLHDMSRFRGDFEYPLSARGYLDFLTEEFNVCCQTYYPVGGMSAFVRGMETKARASGVRIFTGEPVSAIDKDGSDYKITTTKRNVGVKRVVIAVPPAAFSRIGGSVADKIKARPEFQALVGIKVTVVNQWFNEAWWDKVKTADGKGIWRAYTTGHCINFVEIPPESYAGKQKVIRTVYNDQKACADMWSKLAAGPKDALEKELHKGLVHLFENNKVTTNVKVPPATATAYWEWPDAWYWVKAGSKVTNAQVFDWAVEPLPGENVGLVSEGYNPQRSAWTDAAYKSSIHLLNKKYGMSL